LKKLQDNIDERCLHTILNIIAEGIWDWNANTGYVYRSPGWYRMLGYDVDSLDNSVLTWENIIHPDDFQRVMAHFDAFITHTSPKYKIQYRCLKKDGNYLWIEDTAKIVDENEDGSVARVIGSHRDISDEKALAQQNELEKQDLKAIIEKQTSELNQANHALCEKIQLVEKLARTDKLTNISNRFGFESKLDGEISRARRFNESLSLVLFDLDEFKPVNDIHGHTIGDELLVTVGELLTQNLREVDLPVRWGGDEFMILLVNTPLEKATQLAQKIRLIISENAQINKFGVTASFGVACLHSDETAKEFIIRADKALYQAKNQGRNLVITAE
jgi:diguanylate cyclase (GGDEF)-like protein/PAS domain S-box-containing protein